MMVEAESTEATWNLVADGATAPTEDIVSAGLEAAKPFIKVLCDAQAELVAKFPKPTAQLPVFLDYEDDVYAAVEQYATDELGTVMSIADKADREKATDDLKDKVKGHFADEFEGR
jgi:polyribonucleotide nucleotidyltransferase